MFHNGGWAHARAQEGGGGRGVGGSHVREVVGHVGGRMRSEGGGGGARGGKVQANFRLFFVSLMQAIP